MFLPKVSSSLRLPLPKPSPTPISSSSDPTPQAIPNMVRKERGLCARQGAQGLAEDVQQHAHDHTSNYAADGGSSSQSPWPPGELGLAEGKGLSGFFGSLAATRRSNRALRGGATAQEATSRGIRIVCTPSRFMVGGVHFDSFVPFLLSSFGSIAMLRLLVLLLGLLLAAASAFAQGGPPYYTNDPGTPGHLNWEINLAYMPFFYSNQSVSHIPDVDINFGVGDRIQLTYENAWLRVQHPVSPMKFGLGESNPGVKWRFYGDGSLASPSPHSPSFFSTIPTTLSAAASRLPAMPSSCLSNFPGSLVPSPWISKSVIRLSARDRTGG